MSALGQHQHPAAKEERWVLHVKASYMSMSDGSHGMETKERTYLVFTASMRDEVVAMPQ